MAQLEKTLDTLDYKHWYYETVKAAGTCKIHEQMAKEDIPQRMREIKRRMVEGGECEKNKIFAVFHGKALKCAILCVTIADINDGTMESRSAETGGSFSFSPPK